MCSKERIYKIEKERLSDIQSSLDKLLNSIHKMKREFTKSELATIILLNDKMDEVGGLISDLNISLLKKIPSKHLNENLKQELKNHDHAEQVINKFLPAMLAYSMNLF